MRLGNLDGRAVLVVGDATFVDVHEHSGGRFASDPGPAFERWHEIVRWSREADLPEAKPLSLEALRAPSPQPRQVFVIGMNYVPLDGVRPAERPQYPPVFTKFVGALSGPYEPVAHSGGDVAWEVELVVVIGHRAQRIPAPRAWEYVAGLTVGLDLTDRDVLRDGPVANFNISKSYPGFGPTGPWLVTPDEFADPDSLSLGCSVNGDVVQKGNTRQMIFSVPELIERLSSVVPLLPGDVIFTGTPPQQRKGSLQVGDEVVAWIDGIGELRTRIVAAAITTTEVSLAP